MKTTYCPLFRNPGDGGTCPLRPPILIKMLLIFAIKYIL